MHLLDTIPRHVIRFVRLHIGTITTYNAEMERLERFADAIGQAGRYTAEYHLQSIERMQRVQAQLKAFERLARRKNIDPHEVYTALGGLPDVRALSPTTQEW